MIFPKKGISTIGVLVVAIIIAIAVIGAVSYYYLTIATTSSNVRASGSAVNSTGIILYSADAYVNETQTLENAFTTSTGIQTVVPKSAGSQVLGEQIAQGDPVSVFISVSKNAVQNFTLGQNYGGWAIAFAADQMSIAYSNATLQSNGAMAVIASYNTAVSLNTTLAWRDFFSNLTSGSVRVGISNPNEDPAGYRAWLVLQAAAAAYDNNDSSYFATRMVSNTGNITGASAADLVAPLEAGQIQFLFIYKSAGVADKLHLLTLPSQINLGSPAYSSFYSHFSYIISSNGRPTVETGGVIALWITVPKDSIDPNDSVSFVVFVIKNAPTLLASFGLMFYSPSRLFNDSLVPRPIAQLVTAGSLVSAGVLS